MFYSLIMHDQCAELLFLRIPNDASEFHQFKDHFFQLYTHFNQPFHLIIKSHINHMVPLMYLKMMHQMMLQFKYWTTQLIHKVDIYINNPIVMKSLNLLFKWFPPSVPVCTHAW